MHWALKRQIIPLHSWLSTDDNWRADASSRWDVVLDRREWKLRGDAYQIKPC
eukprot:SAG31_NODE_14042_length_830_cov_1.257182_1_plen_51_part_10